jgi:hypothetical protein
VVLKRIAGSIDPGGVECGASGSTRSVPVAPVPSQADLVKHVIVVARFSPGAERWI